MFSIVVLMAANRFWGINAPIINQAARRRHVGQTVDIDFVQRWCLIPVSLDLKKRPDS